MYITWSEESAAATASAPPMSCTTCATVVTGALWPAIEPILSSLSASHAMISQSKPADRRVPRRYDRACTPSEWSLNVARSFHVGTWVFCRVVGVFFVGVLCSREERFGPELGDRGSRNRAWSMYIGPFTVGTANGGISADIVHNGRGGREINGGRVLSGAFSF